jgi:hypothetical protein
LTAVRTSVPSWAKHFWELDKPPDNPTAIATRNATRAEKDLINWPPQEL